MTITLKPWDLEDAPYLARLCQRVDRRYLDYLPEPYNLTDAQFYITNARSRDGRSGIYRAILFDGDIVGCVSAELHADVRCKDGNLGIMVLPEYSGMGVAAAAVRIILKEAFETFDILRMSAEVAEYNAPCRAMLKKCGFLLEGVLDSGFYKDSKACSLCFYGILKRNF